MLTGWLDISVKGCLDQTCKNILSGYIIMLRDNVVSITVVNKLILRCVSTVLDALCILDAKIVLRCMSVERNVKIVIG